MIVREISYEHANGEIIRDQIDPTEDLIFCFVRHPLTWYLSYWQMRQNQGQSDREGGWIDTIIDLPFQSFIKSVIQEKPGYLSNFFNSYVSRCRAIGKQENLREDLNHILSLLHIPYDRQSLFTRSLVNTAPSNEKYSYNLALELMKSEEEIIRRFNYLYIPLEVLDV
uniref:Putative sulfotransferase n=1 Tax=viral metagenome TaxID=1070528 RepID=A0A6H1ZM70_9ZZZZ